MLSVVVAVVAVGANAAVEGDAGADVELNRLVTRLQEDMTKVREEVHVLREENKVLRHHMTGLQATCRQHQEAVTKAAGSGSVQAALPDTTLVDVGASGRTHQRRLSHTAPHGCCRWTSASTCGGNVTRTCTELHEYIEDKTCTHVFTDVASCPGTNPSW